MKKSSAIHFSKTLSVLFTKSSMGFSNASFDIAQDGYHYQKNQLPFVFRYTFFKMVAFDYSSKYLMRAWLAGAMLTIFGLWLAAI